MEMKGGAKVGVGIWTNDQLPGTAVDLRSSPRPGRLIQSDVCRSLYAG
jgi:hypothetical protein